MQASDRRALLVSKGWVQAVALVVLFGFFVLGLLAYRTYMAKPPMPERVVGPAGRGALHRRGHQQGPAGLPAQRADGVRLGLRPRRLPRARLHRRLPAPRVRPRPAHATAARAPTRRARRTIEDFRTNRYDERSGTLTLTAAQAAAFRRLVGHYSRFFSDPTTRHGLRPDAITDPTELRQLTAFFAWTAWAGSTEPPRPQLLLHEQLAARAARRQQADRERGRLVGAVADRAAGRHRPPVRRVRALALPGLARARAGHALVPHAGRRRADAGAARLRVVLLRDGGAVPDPDVRRRRLAALPGRAPRLLRHRPRRRCSRTT